MFNGQVETYHSDVAGLEAAMQVRPVFVRSAHKQIVLYIFLSSRLSLVWNAVKR